MHSIVQKASESKQQTKAKKMPSQGVEKDNTLSIDDQRPETAMQLKLMEGAEQSTRVHQLSAYQRMADKQTAPAQRIQNSGTAAKLGGILQRKEASNSLPEGLKAGVESLSGQSMSDVTVHRNSDKPAQLQAHAYAQGTDIHLGPGQEQHLPHEAWHVAQQKQGRVEPTTQLKAATFINDDKGLEQEADVMGAKAMQVGSQNLAPLQAKIWESTSIPSNSPIQRKKLNLGDGKIQGFGTSIKNLFGKTTFTKLTEEVNKFNSLPEDQQGEQGKIVKALGQKWLDSHKDSKDPNDVLKKTAINQIMIDLKGETMEKAVEKKIFKDDAQAAGLGISEGKIDQKQDELKSKGFVDESGSIKNKKGKLSDTSFMSDAESTIESIVVKAEQNLGAIHSNEKVMRSDAGIHMFFTREREKAASEEERIAVTKHAKDAYNSGFVKNILSDATYSTPKGKQELKPELDASKVKTYRDSSLGAAQEISNLNNTADDDLATLVSYGQHIQNLSKNEKKVKPEDENEEKVQTDRKQVFELLKDATTYEIKVEAQKDKSDNLITPLKGDGRLAGFIRTVADSVQTAAVNKVTNMVSLGLVSAKPKYMTGGLASNEKFKVKKDVNGELKAEEDHEGGKGSKYNFEGPKAVLVGISRKMDKVHSKAAKFNKKKPITQFFVFSGALKEFETGIAYVRQIIGTIQTWAGLVGAAFPIAAPITGAIVGICEVINRIADLVSKSSKVARLIFNSLVKLMNNDPALWGLVSQNFKASGGDMAAIAMAEGGNLAFTAAKGAANGDAAGAVEESLKDKVETDPSAITAKSAAEAAAMKAKGGPSLEDNAFKAGGAATGIGTSIGGDVAKGVIVGDKVKDDKEGKATPIAINTFKSTAAEAVPSGKKVLGQVMNLVKFTKKPDIADPQQISSALDQETTKLNSEGASPDAISEKQEETTATKQEASKAAEVSVGVTDIGEKVINMGLVATRVSEINKRIAAAKAEEKERASQKGFNKK